MTRIAVCFCLVGLVGLASCTAPASGDTTVVGSVEYGGQTYPVEALGPDQTIWRVRAEGGPVTCLNPTLKDCYWSLRNHLNAQTVPDVITP